MQDAQPKMALTTGEALSCIKLQLEQTGLNAMRWLAVDDIPGETAGEWRDPAVTADTLAFLQYTSGSTSHPKGVMVSHSNLLNNHRMIGEAFGFPEHPNFITWLPPFHDMGLIGNILQALHEAALCVLMPPENFLMKPVRWLQAISRYGGQFSGGPNFAYDLCAQRVSEEQRSTLDLSKWELAFVGAEPVRASSLERFSRVFAPCGFRKQALYPCYGLAEATLFVSGASKSQGPRTASFQADALEEHKVAPASPVENKTRTLVGCGHGWLGQEIAIADPATRIPCKQNEVGEIWVSGKNVAQGYWARPAETEHTFRARLADEDETSGETFLRTGDLGFFHDDALFIAGRLKDHIIISGRNHHACDIEHTVEKCHPAIRTGGCAAFPVDSGETERLVVVAELDRSHRDAGLKPIEQAILRAVAEHHDVTAHAVTLLKPAACPRTSSGKIMRHACRTGFLAGTLNTWKEEA